MAYGALSSCRTVSVSSLHCGCGSDIRRCISIKLSVMKGLFLLSVFPAVTGGELFHEAFEVCGWSSLYQRESRTWLFLWWICLFALTFFRGQIRRILSCAGSLFCMEHFRNRSAEDSWYQLLTALWTLIEDIKIFMRILRSKRMILSCWKKHLPVKERRASFQPARCRILICCLR